MSEYIDTAVTVTYRGYEIRDVSNAINPMTGTRGVGGPRCIIKKGGKILNEVSSIELAKQCIDEIERACNDEYDESEEAWREVGRLYHGYMIRWMSDQRDDGCCQIISDEGRGRVVGEEANTGLAKKLIDGEIEGRHPSDWQAGGSKAGWEVDLRTGKPVTD